VMCCLATGPKVNGPKTHRWKPPKLSQK
jgi:hypothetical protein